MYDVQPLLDADARAFLAKAGAELEAKGPAHLPVLWPQLARTVGRTPLAAGRVEDGEAVVDLAAWRTCDAVGLALLEFAGADDETIVDLYLHGDLEEKAVVLRCLAFLPVTAATVRLFGEIQRTNTVLHYEAGALDSNLAVRALKTGGDDAGVTRDDFHRLVLKTAFLDLPVWRMFGALAEADEVLAGMLQGFATEREAAGRGVWVDTNRFLGRAPVAGTVARLLGGLENGADATRLSAAEGLLALGRDDLAPFARERLEREPRDAVRAVLARLAGAAP